MNLHHIYAHLLVDCYRTLYPLSRDVFLLYTLGNQIVSQVQVSYRLFCTFRFLYVQGDLWERVNILGGDKIGHCEKKGSYEQVSNSEWLSR
jgi:hypothetical protein